MTQKISSSAVVPLSASGQRLDQVAAQLFPDYSRSRLQEWIRRGELTVSGRPIKVNARLLGGERLELLAEVERDNNWLPQAMEIVIIYEDEHLLVIDKPADLVVHPAAGNYEGTLLNGLLYLRPELAVLPRAGIVHRLDKDTTGLMVVAKSLLAQANLVKQLQTHTVSRHYRAVVQGHCGAVGRIEGAIGRDTHNRKKMAVVSQGGKEAVTHFTCLRHFSVCSLVECRLETGRTHQIRVHMNHIGLPLVGDPLYGRALRASIVKCQPLRDFLNAFPRQALHACSLSLTHPLSGDTMSWSSELPADFNELIARLEADA